MHTRVTLTSDKHINGTAQAVCVGAGVLPCVGGLCFLPDPVRVPVFTLLAQTLKSPLDEAEIGTRERELLAGVQDELGFRRLDGGGSQSPRTRRWLRRACQEQRACEYERKASLPTPSPIVCVLYHKNRTRPPCLWLERERVSSFLRPFAKFRHFQQTRHSARSHAGKAEVGRQGSPWVISVPAPLQPWHGDTRQDPIMTPPACVAPAVEPQLLCTHPYTTLHGLLNPTTSQECRSRSDCEVPRGQSGGRETQTSDP